MRNTLWAIALSGLFTLDPASALAAAPPRFPPARHAPAATPTARAAHTVTAAAVPPGEPRSSSGVINLNDATADQLELLPGVGPSRATAIINYRKLHPFKHVEELQKIKGIGKKTFARLRPLLALTGPTTLTQRPSRN